ncbi:hypothetical protein V2W23_14140, partial [Staphylococcus gallinarum]|uniref:hypothetical protein n=1 Tax=Staphylococcus gallinarum TaxID=1293 RepID=UPI00316C4463
VANDIPSGHADFVPSYLLAAGNELWRIAKTIQWETSHESLLKRKGGQLRRQGDISPTRFGALPLVRSGRHIHPAIHRWTTGLSASRLTGCRGPIG